MFGGPSGIMSGSAAPRRLPHDSESPVPPSRRRRVVSEAQALALREWEEFEQVPRRAETIAQKVFLWGAEELPIPLEFGRVVVEGVILVKDPNVLVSIVCPTTSLDAVYAGGSRRRL